MAAVNRTPANPDAGYSMGSWIETSQATMSAVETASTRRVTAGAVGVEEIA